MILEEVFKSELLLANLIRDAASDLEFPQYGYGVVQAISLALALNEKGVSILELGVAGGNGLLALERHCETYRPSADLEIELCGFDLGTGMPAPKDYRDAPYVWRENFFKMDELKLRDRLSFAKLIIGDIAMTGQQYIANANLPIGFISFDLDFYSSTLSAFNSILNDAPDKYLPRVVCYFDDTVGPHAEMHSEFTGELLAIKEFNEAQRNRKLAKLNGLSYKVLPITGPWIEGIYILHIFDHPKYNEYIYPTKDRQFPLEV